MLVAFFSPQLILSLSNFFCCTTIFLFHPNYDIVIITNNSVSFIFFFIYRWNAIRQLYGEGVKCRLNYVGIHGTVCRYWCSLLCCVFPTRNFTGFCARIYPNDATDYRPNRVEYVRVRVWLTENVSEDEGAAPAAARGGFANAHVEGNTKEKTCAWKWDDVVIHSMGGTGRRLRRLKKVFFSGGELVKTRRVG